LSTTNPTCQTRARTRAAAVGSQRLTTWAMARPLRSVTQNIRVYNVECYGDYAIRNCNTCGGRRSWPISKYYSAFAFEDGGKSWEIRVTAENSAHSVTNLTGLSWLVTKHVNPSTVLRAWAHAEIGVMNSCTLDALNGSKLTGTFCGMQKIRIRSLKQE
jgi:hypothetical protein